MYHVALAGLDSSTLLLILSLVGLLSFIALFVTSFVKIVIVLSLLRSAMGTPRIPPASVITGVAIILSLYIMYPVFTRAGQAAAPRFAQFMTVDTASGGKLLAPVDTQADEIMGLIKAGSGPFKEFLSTHAHQKEKHTFYNLSKTLTGRQGRAAFAKESFIVLIPAFLLSEIKEAFLIGFLLFLPFLILDLLAANILMALGMHMLSPTAVSLPFKLLLFVSVDGFSLLAHALVASYAVH